MVQREETPTLALFCTHMGAAAVVKLLPVVAAVVAEAREQGAVPAVLLGQFWRVQLNQFGFR